MSQQQNKPKQSPAYFHDLHEIVVEAENPDAMELVAYGADESTPKRTRSEFNQSIDRENSPLPNQNPVVGSSSTTNLQSPPPLIPILDNKTIEDILQDMYKQLIKQFQSDFTKLEKVKITQKSFADHIKNGTFPSCLKFKPIAYNFPQHFRDVKALQLIENNKQTEMLLDILIFRHNTFIEENSILKKKFDFKYGNIYLEKQFKTRLESYSTTPTLTTQIGYLVQKYIADFHIEKTSIIEKHHAKNNNNTNPATAQPAATAATAAPASTTPAAAAGVNDITTVLTALTTLTTQINSIQTELSNLKKDKHHQNNRNNSAKNQSTPGDNHQPRGRGRSVTRRSEEPRNRDPNRSPSRPRSKSPHKRRNDRNADQQNHQNSRNSSQNPRHSKSPSRSQSHQNKQYHSNSPRKSNRSRSTSRQRNFEPDRHKNVRSNDHYDDHDRGRSRKN